jgi:serine/threonine protein phosphatase PrpC
LKVVHAAGLSDAGRRRRHNEDAFVCQPPVFAIADGMGGAQAGELASRLAATAVARSEAEGGTGRERVIALVNEANRSVYERSADDETVSGMGTTMTAALVEGDRVWIGHVGDSRAYLLREGRLEQLTEDHSLVAELVRSGRLTPDEAGNHPHRSVITRALGTDPDVDVDTTAVDARPGDLFVLCSDGLTSMVDDETVLALLERHRSDLEGAARVLIDEANAAGGEDNITVVLFELAGAEALDETRESVLTTTDEDTLHGVPSPFAEAGTPAAAAQRGRWGPRAGVAVAVTGALIVVVGALAVFGLSRSHFVGAEANGHVAVYQGVPWNLPFGVRLYRTVYESPLLAANLSQAERRKLFDHDLQSRGAALRTLHAYEQDVVP